MSQQVFDAKVLPLLHLPLLRLLRDLRDRFGVSKRTAAATPCRACPVYTP